MFSLWFLLIVFPLPLFIIVGIVLAIRKNARENQLAQEREAALRDSVGE